MAFKPIKIAPYTSLKGAGSVIAAYSVGERGKATDNWLNFIVWILCWVGPETAEAAEYNRHDWCISCWVGFAE